MNNVVKMNEQPSAVSLQMPESEFIDVMRNSLYPGASVESVKLVLSYCKAAGLDPMHKPVHIVPMWDKAAKSMRDVIMPGIGSYRTQAARSGQYAGVSEPEFGPDVSEVVGLEKMTFPAWCKVVVKRLMPNGTVAEFAAIERWKENYATKGKDNATPNAMWSKRPYAQLAKCAEAQALRKAFPEFGAQPIAEEMEGKEYGHEVVINHQQRSPEEPAELPFYPNDRLEANLDKWAQALDMGRITIDGIISKVTSGYQLSDDQLQKINALANQSTVIDGELGEQQ